MLLPGIPALTESVSSIAQVPFPAFARSPCGSIQSFAKAPLSKRPALFKVSPELPDYFPQQPFIFVENRPQRDIDQPLPGSRFRTGEIIAFHRSPVNGQRTHKPVFCPEQASSRLKHTGIAAEIIIAPVHQHRQQSQFFQPIRPS